jgi:hypothetical protein
LSPGIAQRRALEGRCKEEGDRIGYCEAHDTIDDAPEVLMGKDSEIEAENRYLGDAKSKDVEYLSIEIVAEDIGYLVVFQCPHVST